ncbi:MAG: hypothetical protein KDK34_21385, partial [Leptospiraceae bacterium]|nr:hypothetical protein [Leptospiraceae bacterium]
IGDYIEAYMQSRNTDGSTLPDGGYVIFERLAQMEWQRIQNDATLNGGITQLNEQEYFGDYRAYIFLQMVAEYTTAHGVTLSGADIDTRRDNYRTAFEDMLDDATYVRDGKTIRQRLLSSNTINAYFDLAFSHLEEGTDVNDYIPAYMDELIANGEENDPLKTAEEYLPAELLAIANYDTTESRDALSALDARYADENARLNVLGELSFEMATGTYQPALELDDAQLDAIIERAGESGASAALKTELRDLLRKNIQATYLSQAQALSEEGIAQMLRQERAYELVYTNAAERETHEEFYAREGARIQSIENKFFTALSESDDRLREAAREERGAFMAALIEKSQGNSTAFYTGLSADEQTAFDDLVSVLFGGTSQAFSAEEQSALQSDVQGYQNEFQSRSNAELTASGIFEALEGSLQSVIVRKADDAQLSAARENRAAYLKAYIEKIEIADGLRGALSADSAAALAATPGMEALFDEALTGMDPDMRKIVRDENVLITRFLSDMLEDDAQRRT